nr:hypothetical protein [Tanacetum cinerariifolium]
MHNNIMAAGSKDRPAMLAMGRYAQWRSRFLGYIDTRPNGDALRKCIIEVLEHTTVETIPNRSPENKAHFESEKEAIHLILTRIGDEIYSTVDACKTAYEIETMESYYTRFYKLMNEMIRNHLTVATMQVNVQFLQQLQPEWSRIAKTANPLTLVATAQLHQDSYYQTSKSHKVYVPTSKTSLKTRSHATTRHKGKEIAKPITPPSESASEEDSDPKQAQKDKEMQKNLALVAKSQNDHSHQFKDNVIFPVDFKFVFLPPMGTKRIVRVDRLGFWGVTCFWTLGHVGKTMNSVGMAPQSICGVCRVSPYVVTLLGTWQNKSLNPYKLIAK